MILGKEEVKMRVLYLTNIPAPYRVSFFNELGKFCELTVLFETLYSKERDKSWISDDARNFEAIYMKGIRCGVAEAICPEVMKYLSTKKYDVIVVGMYSSPTGMLAIEYMRVKKIKFILNTDGGIKKQDSPVVYKVKRHFIRSAVAWLSTGKTTTDYLCNYGAEQKYVYTYPFTSVKDRDVLRKPLTRDDKRKYRKIIGMSEKKIIISVGQFIHRKGYDVLLEACNGLNENIGVYIIGGKPTQEYIELQEQYSLTNIHFIDFLTKDELSMYYKAADVFVLPTREDIWGLVINEAMAFGLPVVTTKMCVAGTEMIEDGISGYVLPNLNSDKLRGYMEKAFDLNPISVLERAKEYTIENMATKHMEIFYCVCSHTRSN